MKHPMVGLILYHLHMTAPRPPCDRLEKLFHRRKSWMLHQLAERLGYALISVRRFLKQIGYYGYARYSSDPIL